MFRQPTKADYIKHLKDEYGMYWRSEYYLAVDECEYDENGDILDWATGEGYEGRALRRVPNGVPLQLDIRNRFHDKVDDFCIIIDPETGHILNGWSCTNHRAHELLKLAGCGSWDNIESQKTKNPHKIVGASAPTS